MALAITILTFDSSSCIKKNKTTMDITKQSFGILPDSKEAFLYTLTNANGVSMQVTNYGGIIKSLKVPDRNGKLDDVVLGYDSLSSYVKDTPFFGALIGRYGNRIAKGKFTLDGKEYSLACNDGPNHLHGGVKGFDKVVWEATEIKQDSAVGIKLHRLSKDGEEGYPGNLDVTVTYLLNNNNELSFEYSATTDKATPVNLTQHSYFNLAGQSSGDIKNHEIMINASKYTVVDATLIPTSELRDVKGTPWDFTSSKPIGKDLAATGGNPVGYDHNFVLNTKSSREVAVRVVEPTTGRVLEVFTDEPGVQFYSGNFLTSKYIGKGGKPYAQYDGFCLETQHFPDSPNQPTFPSTILKPGDKYYTKTIYKFSTIK
jgi:aldose 1-epimerase